MSYFGNDGYWYGGLDSAYLVFSNILESAEMDVDIELTYDALAEAAAIMVNERGVDEDVIQFALEDALADYGYEWPSGWATS